MSLWPPEHAELHRERAIRRAVCTECGHAPLDHLSPGAGVPTDQLACAACGGMFDLDAFSRPVVHLEYTYQGARHLACYDPDVDDILVIGRVADAGIRLAEPIIARRQCGVLASGGLFRVIKMGGAHPIRHNDELLDVGDTGELANGDVIGLMLGDDGWLWIEVSIADV